MKKIAVSAFVAAMFLAHSAAWALYDVTGKIRSIDKTGHEIVLANGQYYIIPVDLSLDNFKVGDVVNLSVHQYHDGLNYVEAVTKAN